MDYLSYAADPKAKDVLRLGCRPDTQHPSGGFFPCFFRIKKDGTLENVAMRHGTELLVTCACHPGERRMRYELRFRMEKGYPCDPTLVYRKNGAAALLERVRSTHSSVKAIVL